jgi:hypothetical protein
MRIKHIFASVALSASLLATAAQASDSPQLSPVDQDSVAMDQMISSAKADFTSTYPKTRFFHGQRNGLEAHELFLIGMTEEVIDELLTVSNKDFFMMDPEEKQKNIKAFFNNRFEGASFYDIDIERQVIEITLENYLLDGFRFDYSPENMDYLRRVTQILSERFIDLGDQYLNKSRELIDGGMSIEEFKEKTTGMTIREFLEMDILY